MVLDALFSPDGTRVITASRDNTACIWDASSGTLAGEPLRHEDSVYCASFSPDGTRVVTTSADKTARIWDAASEDSIGEPLEYLRDTGWSASFSPDGTRVVTVSKNTARIWDAASGTPLGEPLRHKDSVSSASFSPDGTRVVTASRDNTARIWDTSSGKSVDEPLRHGAPVYCASFSPDGTRVVTASMDRTARIWNLEFDTGDFPYLADLLLLASGNNVSFEGGIEEIPLSIMFSIRSRLLHAAEQLPPNRKRLIQWICGQPSERTLSPFSDVTITEHIDSEIDWCFEHQQSDQCFTIIHEAAALSPAHPLIQLALASVEEHPIRKAFLIGYGTQRLPDDSAILSKAASYLRKLDAPKETLAVVERAFAHQPDDPVLLEIRAWAAGQR